MQRHPPDPVLAVSDILLKHHELSSFEQMKQLVKTYARDGEVFLAFDVRPPFEDTPENWEAQLEAAFTAAANVKR